MKWFLLIVGMAGVISFLIFSPSVQDSHQFSASVQNALSSRQTGASLPVRLKIPNINVDALIDQIGVISEGEMEAPNGPKNVGWFKFGAIPGDVGTAVIAGHYGRWKTGEGSVFDNLNRLKEGDKIYVENDNQEIITFVVRESRTYVKDEEAKEVFSSSDGIAHLNLVTCEGIWDKVKKTYSNRLVVFADLFTL